jgi:hypothetical protein
MEPVRFRDVIANDIITWRKVVNAAAIVAEAGRQTQRWTRRF